MKNTELNYQDGEQLLKGMLYTPENAKGGGVVVYPAFEGRSQFALDYAQNIANKGYVTLCADIYGDAKTADTLEGCFQLIGPFLEDRSLVRRRSVLAHEALLSVENVCKDKTATIGFCFGGLCALEVIRNGSDVRATIGMHSVLAKSNLSTNPIKSKILILHGYQDPQVPPENFKAFADEMHTAGADDWTFTFFGNGKHSFTDPLTGTFDPEKEKEMGREFNKEIANRAYRYAVDFLNEWL